ncbi:methyltransferase [Candidatus Giovannonibacteria bacterium RIFCSPLOWO2_02_44_8]|uniref:Methyltransferase n=2 Tax=Candidatus Giovannoniibacteriota TaxID=1752738 RepID=A0A1F5XCC3_9BACT|nr:MAG: methyltransferase [Candidatus Giovannonibacteria bacterium RIFCSPLOWO2_02_44_8]OGF95069.1 MAG: methyltransferase [Candidatus Giovannonibacteria bacterium RIFCSPLOWO2_12_43_8]
MEVISCRICQSRNLQNIIDLGFHPPSDAFLTSEELKKPEISHPLRVLLCDKCGLWQLDYVVDPEILYQRSYPYESSTTRTGRKHFHDMAKEICDKYETPKGSLAVDIGSNVGVLLQGFETVGMKTLGVDPAFDMARIANQNGILTIADFFTRDLSKKIAKQYGKAHAITATNVVAHINDIHNLVSGVKNLLAPTGVFVIEAPYLVDLVQKNEYDTIYHEHLSYLSVKPLVGLFKSHDMELIDAEKQNIHGGTMRYFIAHKGKYKVSPVIKKLIAAENKFGIYDINFLKKTFVKAVEKQRADLVELLMKLKKEGARIVGVSAPAKGNTLLNYCKIDNQYLDYISEKAEIKIGLHTPGTHIKIESDKRLMKDMPDYALILAWNFADEIMGNLKEFKKKNGRFIIPIPKPVII